MKTFVPVALRMWKVITRLKYYMDSVDSSYFHRHVTYSYTSLGPANNSLQKISGQYLFMNFTFVPSKISKRKNSVVNSTECISRGFSFNIQHSHDISYMFVIPDKRDPKTRLALSCIKVIIMNIYKCRENTQTHEERNKNVNMPHF